MPGPERKAKLPPDLATARPASPPVGSLLRQKRAAIAAGYRPQDRLSEGAAEARLLPATPVARPVEIALSLPPGALGDPKSPVPRSHNADIAAEEHLAAKQALAAELEDMIGGMLRTTQFATAATTRTRTWTRQVSEAAALDASTTDIVIAGSSLVADLTQARPAPAVEVRPAARRRWWVDAVLVLACLLTVLSAGYFTFAL